MWSFLSALTSDPNPWAQLGLSSIVAVLLFGALSVVWKAYQAERNKNELLQIARVQDAKDSVTRERELADRLGPLLANAAEVLSTAPARFDQALGQVQSASRMSEVDNLMSKLEQTVSRIATDRGLP